jgi:hypothetical protein
MRIKIKGDAYLALAKAAAGLTDDRILEALVHCKVEPLRHSVPEEFCAAFEQNLRCFQVQAPALETTVRQFFAQCPRGVDRKESTLWVQANVPPKFRGAVFQLLDGRQPNWYALLARGHKGQPEAPIG